MKGLVSKENGAVSVRNFGIKLMRVRFTPCPGAGVLPYMGYIGMWRCGGYGFQAVYSRIGYINQSLWISFFTKLTGWLKILSRLRKPGIATQKYKESNRQSLNLRNSASTVSTDGYHKTLLDVINCQKSGFRRKSVV